MLTGPSCLLHLGILESPDYWTDNALVEAAAPATEPAWKPWAHWTAEEDSRSPKTEVSGVEKDAL